MENRTFTDLAVFNALNMNEFELINFIKDEDSLIVRAHSGSPNLFWDEIKFLWIGYIACPTYFFDVQLRMATETEIANVGPHKNASKLYCFEDTLATENETRDRFFIAANAVEITVYYGGENLDKMLSRATVNDI